MKIVKQIATLAAIFAAAIGITYLILAVIDAPAAHADDSNPMCNFSHTCSWSHQYNGPLMPTWELPGGYGFPGGPPVQCNPSTYQCYPVAPGY